MMLLRNSMYLKKYCLTLLPIMVIFYCCSGDFFQNNFTYRKDINLINLLNKHVSFIDTANCLSFPQQFAGRKDIISIFFQNSIDSSLVEKSHCFSYVNDSLSTYFSLIKKNTKFFRVDVTEDTLEYLDTKRFVSITNYYVDSDYDNMKYPMFQEVDIYSYSSFSNTEIIILRILYYHSKIDETFKKYDFKKIMDNYCVGSRASN